MVGRVPFVAGWAVAVIALLIGNASQAAGGALFVLAGLLVVASAASGDLQGWVQSTSARARSFVVALCLVLGLGWVVLGVALALA
jgi:hypothetical protein